MLSFNRVVKLPSQVVKISTENIGPTMQSKWIKIYEVVMNVAYATKDENPCEGFYAGRSYWNANLRKAFFKSVRKTHYVIRYLTGRLVKW